VLPIQCPSCSQKFKSDQTFTHHLEVEAHCDAGGDDAEPIKGLENLLEKIRPTNKSKSEPLEEDMWKALYRTLFPDDPKDQIPSPYFDREQERYITMSPNVSSTSVYREAFTPLSFTPEPQSSASSMRGLPAAPARTYSQQSFVASERSQMLSNTLGSREVSRSGSPNDEHRPSDDSRDSKRNTLKKKLHVETMEEKVDAFRTWKKPHRTDEYITPGAYRKFWQWVARFFTFYIPSWFLTKFYKMNDIRQRLAWRQKVLFCVVLFAIYALVSYFLVIQPVASCVVKVRIGLIPAESSFCSVVTNVVYVYMGLGGTFTLLVLICVGRIRYESRKFEERDALLIMHMPCYNETESVLRKTIQSCVESSYDKSKKMLFIVADGIVAAPGQKPTYKILLEDIFDHSTDLEAGFDNRGRSYTSYDLEGVSDNVAMCCMGYYQRVPYVVVIKTGREDEQDAPKPGNRGKRDSQLLVYNFFHYVNYRRFWSPLFEDIEYKMRNILNLDARDAMHMLVVDCDTEVDKTGISYMVDKLEKDPKLLGVCGYTGVNNPMDSLVACSQVFEYWLTHAVLKALESVCSNVLVLSGCFTIYRLKWRDQKPAILHPLLLEDYAGSYEKTLHEHNLLSIGEDRYLSTLAIRYFGADCRLRYFSAAKCTTTAPDTFSVLLDQRRRWTNSLVHCHFAHLNVLPFEASFWTNARLIFVIGAELFMVFVLPLALPAGLVLAIVSIWLTPYAWAILLAFLLLPVLICIFCNDWPYVPFYLPFFPMIAYFSIVIPLYSIWRQDNIKWGKTRG